MHIPFITKRTLDPANVTILIAVILLGMLSSVILFVLPDEQSKQIAISNATEYKPETYTELYFTHPDTLPNSYKNGQAVPVDFGISNKENRKVDYRYVVQQVDSKSGKIIQLTQGTVSLQKDAAISVIKNVPLISEDERVKIVIRLINVDQQIAYWVTRNE